MTPTHATHEERHAHTEVTVHVLRQRRGVPYEFERKICLACGHVLAERPLRRTVG